MRTMVLAAIGFAVLLAVVPPWARWEVTVFGAAFAALVYALDDDVRGGVRRMLDSGLRRNDTSAEDDATKARAKSPAARRAAT